MLVSLNALAKTVYIGLCRGRIESFAETSMTPVAVRNDRIQHRQLEAIMQFPFPEYLRSGGALPNI
jgi:hypothetical protein